MKSKFLLEQFMEANRIEYGEPFWVDTPSGKQRLKIETINLKEYVTHKADYIDCLVPAIFISLSDNNNWQLAHSNLLRDVLFNEKFKIIKPVWKPQIDDCYFIINENGNAYQRIWRNDIDDISHFLSGNCFKSKLEAETNKGKILKLFAKERPLIDLNEVE